MWKTALRRRSLRSLLHLQRDSQQQDPIPQILLQQKRQIPDSETTAGQRNKEINRGLQRTEKRPILRLVQLVGPCKEDHKATRDAEKEKPEDGERKRRRDAIGEISFQRGQEFSCV